MNDQRPTDPREQLEVRITALLLGEASAFEEAELLDAIKHDPALAAYYEAMRQTVKRVEETIQLTPVEAATTHSTLSEERRGKLEELFKQPTATKAVKLDSRAGRTRRLGWPQHAAAIAAAMVILLCVIGLLLPSLAKPKAKASRMAALNQARELELEERIRELDAETQSPPATPAVASASTGEPAIVDADAEGKSLARFGSSQNVDRSSRPAKTQAVPPAKPADIYLPAAAVDTAGVPVQMYADGAERGLAADNTVRYYFRNGRDAALKDGAPVEGEAVVAGSPMSAFVVPAPSAVLPKPAPAPLELQAGRPELLTDSLARKGDAAVESETILGRKVAVPVPGLTAKSEVEELRPEIVAGSRILSSEAERRFRGLSDIEAKDSARGRTSGGIRGAQVDGLASLASVRGPQPDPNALLASSNGGGGVAGRGVGGVASPSRFGRGNQWDEGRSVPAAPGVAGGGAVVAGEPIAPGGPINAPTAAGQSLGYFDTPGTGAPVAAYENQVQAANTWSADFGAIAAAPAVESFGRDAVADDFVANGQVATELFAKQQTDSKSVERLDRLGEETSLGLTFKEAKVPVEPMYEERLLTEERQLDRERVKELSDQLAVRGERTGPAEVELKRNAADSESLGVLEDRASGEQVLKTQVFDVNPDTLYQGMEGVFASSLGGGQGGQGQGAGGSVFAQITIAPGGAGLGGGAGGGQQGAGGIRLLTATNDMSEVNVAMRDYLKAVGVNLTGAGMVHYNDRTGRLMVKAPASESDKIQQAVEMLNYSPPRDLSGSTQSRFDTLADLSSSEFAMVADNGREQQLKQQLESAEIAAPEPAKRAEELVEAPPAAPPPSLEPLPEIRTTDNAFSTFSLNVSDVSFQLAASSIENGQMPDGARLRSEEFINAFDYRDPAPAPGQRVAFNWERARNPFAHNRELLRLSVQTAAAGREPGQPLNLVLLLDNSGSMERADRVQITEQMLRVLAAQLTGYDRVSFITFARTPRLIIDGAAGGNPEALLRQVTGLNPDGGTNLEDAMKLAYETAAKHFQANGNNRVILITDGAANLGNVDPAQLRERVIEQRKRGIALDCFGVGWEGYNDNLLESLSRNGDGRYGFLNDAEIAPAQFASQLAGALQVAAADVKAQVEFNPNRVTVYRQIGYQQHQLTKEQFRDNTVDAAEIGAAEAGNALYSVEINPNGSGPIGTFRARYRVPSTGQYEEKEWVLDYTPVAPELEKSGPAMRLASSSAAFAEWLANSPYAQTVTPDALQNLLRGVPEVYSPDPRPAKLQAMIQQARAISGR